MGWPICLAALGRKFLNGAAFLLLKPVVSVCPRDVEVCDAEMLIIPWRLEETEVGKLGAPLYSCWSVPG